MLEDFNETLQKENMNLKLTLVESQGILDSTDEETIETLKKLSSVKK